MKTSYFAKYRGDNAVSIALKCPNGFVGTQYSALFPRWWFLKEYFEDKDEQKYTERYYKHVLDKLDPEEVYEDLKDSVILCWEGPDKFCHRHIVAKWLMDNLNVEIGEI